MIILLYRYDIFAETLIVHSESNSGITISA